MALNCCPALWCWPWPLLDMDTAAGPRCCQAGDTAALALAWPLRALSPRGLTQQQECVGNANTLHLRMGRKQQKENITWAYFFCGKLKKNALIREGSRATTQFFISTVFMLCIVLG